MAEFYFVYATISVKTKAVATYGAEHALPQLTPNQWDLVEKIVAVLNPVEEITQSIATEVRSFSISRHALS